MLKARILTALCLFPMVILSLFLPQWLFIVLVFGVIMLGAWEYSTLVAFPDTSWRISFLVIIGLGFIAGLFFPLSTTFFGLLWWGCAAILLIKFPLGQKQWLTSALLRGLIGVLLLVPCGAGLVLLHNRPQGSYWVLLLLLIVWAADIGAYFAGKHLGKQLLAPLVSPKKTLEGVCGGLMASIIVTIIVALCWQLPIFTTFLFMLTVVVVFIVSVMGDLTESAIKRWMNVKDSGTLLPGHGGFLDRIDSLTAAAPVFSLALALLLS